MPVLVSEQGYVASWGSMSEASTLLAAIAPASFDLTVAGDTADITTLASTNPTGRAFLPLRKQFNVTLTGALTGYVGGSVCTIASGGSEYDVHVQSFNLTIDAPVVETTELGSASPDSLWKAFIPTIPTVTATITAMVDDATLITLPPAFGAGSPSTFTVTYKSGHTITFTGFYSSTSLSVPNSGLQQVTFNVQGTGPATFAGSTTPLFANSTVVGRPLTTGITLDLHSDSDTSYTGDAFWNNISLAFDRNSVTQATIACQGTGDLTLADGS